MVGLREGEFVGSLDCGTTSVRFIIFDKHANIVAQHQLEFPQYYPQPGWHEHDAVEIQDFSDKCIEEAVAALETAGWKKESIKAIGVTNQRETTVAWSRSSRKPLCKAIVWDDSRTKHTVHEYSENLRTLGIEVEKGKFLKGEEGIEWVRNETGLPFSTYFSAIKLRYMIDTYPEVKKAHEAGDLLFGTVESWVAYNLLGGQHITEPTNASRTLLLNAANLDWSYPMLNFFGFRPSILPRIVSTSEVYGSVTYGSLRGIRIGGLVGDQQAALIGNKCLKRGEAKCTYGTGAFLLYNTGNDWVKSGHGLISTVAYQAGRNAKPVYALEGSIAVAGSAIKWLRDGLGIIKHAHEINTFATSVEDTAGLYFVTAFSGLLAPYWDPSAAGLLIGLTSYTTPSHIAKATLESNAFQTRGIVNCMLKDVKDSQQGSPAKDVHDDLHTLKVDGGMTNGDEAMSILAALTGFTVVRPEMRESTALGSALCAGAAVGLFGWDLNKPETLTEVNTKGNTVFEPGTTEQAKLQREKKWRGWERAVARSLKWEEEED